ncbi:MAG: glutamyl-tRNA reductase, partial [Actinobacteria bacterium]|nr:glutamyl-tRNA reductase [Actinomycetota bacterium]
GLEAVAADGLSAALDDADLIVACTRTDEPLLVPADLDRTGDPRVVIDLGMPRNVEAAVGDLPAVELLDLERLAGSMERGPVPRAAEADARRMVDESVSAFALAERDRRAERQAVPALRALRDHVLAVMEQELAHARAQSAAGQISPDRAEAMLRHFAGRLLHEPTTRIRRLGREGRSESANTLVRELFES